MDPELPAATAPATEPAPVTKPSLLTKIGREGWQYVFQFFMLFLAVTAGFFADNLREDFGERKQSREYAQSLIHELAQDTLNIRYHIWITKTAINDISALANYVRDKKIDQLTNEELYRRTSFPPVAAYRWSRATIQQIKSSGSLRNFSNDSIVYFISEYDAWTQHLDQDNFEDQERYRYASLLKGKIVDLNYPEDFKKKLIANPDSLMKEWPDPKPLLTHDLNEIKALVNAYLVALEYSTGRLDELANLIKDHRRLIRLLKREYKLQ